MTKFDRVVELAKAGHPPREIEALMRDDARGPTTRQSVCVMLHRARQRGLPVPRFKRVVGDFTGIAIVDLYDLAEVDFADLERAAEARGVSVEALGARIVAGALRRGLIAATLGEAT